jgi:hypothetical protein
MLHQRCGLCLLLCHATTNTGRLGKSDPFFFPPGAEAFKHDNPRAEVHFMTPVISLWKRTIRKSQVLFETS